jgi:uncharacterized protein (TIGR02284 family)
VAERIDNSKVISILNNLIETCKDGQEGFREAAEAAKDPHLRSLFSEFSLQRAEFAGELQTEIRSLGGAPERSGSVSGSIHRGWINLKTAITGGSDAAIISECERGEDSAKKNYREALEPDLPANISSLVERQYRQLQQVHEEVRNLEVKLKG